MTDPGKAVFLSYASQDADAVLHLCNALRAAGIEVWFDQSELRGGDAWDASIRRQIKSCALFIPVISKNTHARGEGYFRLEWKLAVDRSHLMASDLPFLLPVVVDETSDQDERVPDRFREVQWTRLPAGGGADAFVERVHRLLKADLMAPAPPAATAPSRNTPSSPASARSSVSSTRSFLPWGIGGVLILAMGYILADKFLLPRHAVRAAAAPATAPVRAEAMNDKSIAVLPFADLSEKHDQEYFAAGLSAELADVLGKLPDLRVISRASSFQFKGKSEDFRGIGAQLGAAHLVEGSVRRSGDHVRVSAQLIRSADGAHEWSGAYDRNVDDLLQVQSEIAMSLGRALELSVSDLEETRATARPNAEAYDLYLRGLHDMEGYTRDGLEQANSYLQRAIELDPQFIRPYEQLALVHFLQADYQYVPGNSGFARAKDDAVQLLKMNPKSAWGHTILCRYHWAYSWDWSEAARESAAALSLAPHSWPALYAAADLALTLGEYNRSERLFRAVLATDPLNADTHLEISQPLLRLGRLGEAETEARRGLIIAPTFVGGHYFLGVILMAQGRIEDAVREFQLEAPEGGRQAGLAIAHYALGRKSDAKTKFEQLIRDVAVVSPFAAAEVSAYFGDANHAIEWLERAYQQKDPDLPRIKGDWLLRSIEGDPRYKEFLRKMKLPE